MNFLTAQHSMYLFTKKDTFLCLLLFCISLLYNLLFLNRVLPFLPDEARYASVALGMLTSHDYIIPTLNGVPFLDKPPLYYWLVALSLKIFGINGYGMRLPIVLFSAVGISVTYAFTHAFWGRKMGLWASFILMTSPLYFLSSHCSNMDIMVSVLLWCAFCCFVTGLYQSIGHWRRPLLFYTGYSACALAFLTKGLIAFAFPFSVFLMWNGWIFYFFPYQRALLKQVWQSIYLVSGLVLVALIVLPWLLLAQYRIESFLSYFFYEQQIFRFFSYEFNQKAGIWFYPVIACVGTLPWSLIALLSPIWVTFPFKERLKHHPTFFVMAWTLFVLLFFSIPASKLLCYALIFFPSLAILLALLCEPFVGYLSTKFAESLFLRWHGPLFMACFCFVFNPLFYASIRNVQDYSIRANVQHSYSLFFTSFFIEKGRANLSIPLSSFLPPQFLPLTTCAEALKQFQTHDLKTFIEIYDARPLMYNYYFAELPLYLKKPLIFIQRWDLPPVPGDGPVNLMRWGIKQYRERFHTFPSWFLSYDQFHQLALASKKPLVIFLRTADSKKLEETLKSDNLCTLARSQYFLIMFHVEH